MGPKLSNLYPLGPLWSAQLCPSSQTWVYTCFAASCWKCSLVVAQTSPESLCTKSRLDHLSLAIFTIHSRPRRPPLSWLWSSLHKTPLPLPRVAAHRWGSSRGHSYDPARSSLKEIGEVVLKNFKHFIRFVHQLLMPIRQNPIVASLPRWPSIKRAHPVTLIPSRPNSWSFTLTMHPLCSVLRCYANANLTTNILGAQLDLNTSSRALTRSLSIPSLLSANFLLNLIDSYLMALWELTTICYLKWLVPS